MGDDSRGAAQAGWGPSSILSFKCAKQHFDVFIKAEIKNADDGVEIAKLLFGEEAPNNPCYASARKRCISVRVMNRFAYYLAVNARHLNNSKKMLEFMSADRYLSSIKTAIERDEAVFYVDNNNNQHAPLLNKSNMKLVRNGMFNIFFNRAAKSHRSMSQSHKSADQNDIIRICMICLWLGDFRFAQLLFFILSLVHFCGRGSEVAVLQFYRILLVIPAEFLDSKRGRDKIAKVSLYRTKTKDEQELHVFHHRDCFLMCWYWGLGYSMVLNEGLDLSSSLFPHFVKDGRADQDADASAEVEALDAAVEAENAGMDAAMRANDADVSPETTEAKGVSQYFKSSLEQVAQSAEQLTSARNEKTEAMAAVVNSDGAGPPTADGPLAAFAGDGTEIPVDGDSDETSFYEKFLGVWYSTVGLMFSPGLSAHSSKRYSVNCANEFAYIATTWVCFRAGWMMKAVHTIFDYLDSNPKNDCQVARVIANWTMVGEGGKYGGGRPPTLEVLIGQGGTPKAVDGGVIGEPGEEKWAVQQLMSFMGYLFHNYNNVLGANDPQLQILITASILLRLPQMLQCLKEHPNQMYGTTDESCFEKHRFLQLLLCAARRANVANPIAVMNKWAVLIEKDFHRRNYMFVRMEDLQRTLGHQGFVCDTRSLTGYMKSQADEMRALREHSLEVINNQRRMLQELVEMKQMLYEQTKCNMVLQKQMAEMRGQQVVQAAAPAPVTPSNATSQWGSMVALPQPSSVKGLTVKGAFLSWHRDGYCHSNKKDTHGKHVRSSIKISVEYFSLFFDEHIVPLPRTANCGAAAPIWDKELKEKTNHAWEAAEAFAADVDKGKKLSESLNAFKEFMFNHTSELPQGPAGETTFQPPTGRLRTRLQLMEHKNTSDAGKNKKRKAAPPTTQGKRKKKPVPTPTPPTLPAPLTPPMPQETIAV
jgi:hypothetical protein